MKRTQSLVHQLAAHARETPEAAAIHGKVDGVWKRLTWAEYFAQVREVAKGLIALGHQPTRPALARGVAPLRQSTTAR